MPCSAAALVTSGSFAAPSSIEYSVCTCRCTKESDEPGLLTGGRTPQWSCVPDRGRSGGRPAGKTGGAEIWGIRWAVPAILALRTVYAEGLTERVPSQLKDPLPPTARKLAAGPCRGPGRPVRV